MLKAVLFDLDGTLLPLDQHEFTRQYLRLLAGRVAHLVEPQRLVAQVLASTAAMVADTRPEFTNEQVFVEHFYPGLQVAAQTLLPIFDDFYDHEFGQLLAVTKPSPLARAAVTAVVGQGLLPVVATNPIFPLKAIRHRLNWAEVADLPFKLVTCYENSHFCKPQLEYYQEILAVIGCRPAECLMVGNDAEEDLAAGKLGLKTYLVTDWLLNDKQLPLQADYTGSLQDLAEFLAGSDLRSL